MGHIIRVASASDPDIEYRVDLESLTCTCRDWIDRRQIFQKSDPRRLCKHLLQGILGEDAIPDCLAKYEDTLYRYTNFEKRGFPPDKALARGAIRGTPYDIFLPRTENDGWINIYSEEGKWGYNIYDERWSYGEEPEDAKELIGIMQKMLNKIVKKNSVETKNTNKIILSSDKQIDGLIDLGLRLVEDKKYNEAASAYTLIIGQDTPKAALIVAYYSRGRCFDILGEKEKAMSDMIEAAALGSEEAINYIAENA